MVRCWTYKEAGKGGRYLWERNRCVWLPPCLAFSWFSQRPARLWAAGRKRKTYRICSRKKQSDRGMEKRPRKRLTGEDTVRRRLLFRRLSGISLMWNAAAAIQKSYLRMSRAVFCFMRVRMMAYPGSRWSWERSGCPKGIGQLRLLSGQGGA